MKIYIKTISVVLIIIVVWFLQIKNESNNRINEICMVTTGSTIHTTDNGSSYCKN